MKFLETALKGAYIIELDVFTDHRGKFIRTFCAEEFQKKHLKSNMVQSNLSVTKTKGTIRGMHYQFDGAEEVKLVRCARGVIMDVIIDIRPDSITFGNHIKVDLVEDDYKMIYIPEGFAHGFLTKTDQCEIFYQVSNFYNPIKEKGIRWNDPMFNINWGIKDPIISEKDSKYPDFKEII